MNTTGTVEKSTDKLSPNTAVEAVAPASLYPCVVLYDKSRMALAIKEENGKVVLVSHAGGIYHCQRIDQNQFKRNFEVCNHVWKLGKTAPTVKRYVEVLNHSSCEITEEAFNLIKELEMKTMFVTKDGKIVATMPKDGDALQFTAHDAKALPEASKQLETFLSTRARGTFVTTALSLEKAVERVKNGDKRIAEAITRMLNGSGDAPASAAATARSVRPSALKKTPITNSSDKKNVTRQRAKVGVKTLLYEFFSSGGKGDLDVLVKKFNSTDVSVRTAISDIRSEKYAPNNKPLNIKKDDKGIYAVFPSKK